MIGIILTIHIVISIIIIAIVLLQHGKGADIGASFGSGSSQTVFGSQGAAPFLMKMTAFMAALFFATSLILGYLSQQKLSDMNQLKSPVPAQKELTGTSSDKQGSKSANGEKSSQNDKNNLKDMIPSDNKQSGGSSNTSGQKSNADNKSKDSPPVSIKKDKSTSQSTNQSQ